MAKKKKKKHGKIEKKKKGPFLRFKLGVLLLLIVLSFGGTFGVYLFAASSDPDYWQNEILSSMMADPDEREMTLTKNRQSITNPVPLSDRADDSYMEKCAFIGVFSPLTGYYTTKAELVFTDNVTGMSESRMNSISRNVTEAEAIYIWYNYPDSAEDMSNALKTLISVIQGHHNTPIYILNVIPSADAEQSRKIDSWNSQLFAICDAYAVHYVDINTGLKSDANLLADEYQDNEVLYQTIGELILTHIDN